MAFSSDRTALRCVCRISRGFLEPASIVKIATTP